eukprot:1031523-Pyramimonas_sp.AAC.1
MVCAIPSSLNFGFSLGTTHTLPLLSNVQVVENNATHQKIRSVKTQFIPAIPTTRKHLTHCESLAFSSWDTICHISLKVPTFCCFENITPCCGWLSQPSPKSWCPKLQPTKRPPKMLFSRASTCTNYDYPCCRN